jgi:hypothetical protein
MQWLLVVKELATHFLPFTFVSVPSHGMNFSCLLCHFSSLSVNPYHPVHTF